MATDIHHLRVLPDIHDMFGLPGVIVARECVGVPGELQDVVEQGQRISDIMLIYILNAAVILPGVSGLVAPGRE